MDGFIDRDVPRPTMIDLREGFKESAIDLSRQVQLPDVTRRLWVETVTNIDEGRPDFADGVRRMSRERGVWMRLRLRDQFDEASDDQAVGTIVVRVIDEFFDPDPFLGSAFKGSADFKAFAQSIEPTIRRAVANQDRAAFDACGFEIEAALGEKPQGETGAAVSMRLTLRR
jgi:hypothetical protein